MSRGLALVTGASGYIGSHLVPALLAEGWRVRVFTRSPAGLSPAWRDEVEVAVGDATSADDVRAALDGADVAYYLLHSMDGKPDFRARDKALAETFAVAAARCGVRRIVYLSGLHEESAELSDHLASRVEVGEAFLRSGVPTAVLQAGVVMGHGSASYEMLRHLSERLPAAVGPKWLRNRIQPISVRDVVHYLVHAADLDPSVNRTIDVGMDEVLTYVQMMRRYARAAGLGRRLVGTVPVLTPGLASHWVGLVTPVSSGIARPLVGSLIHEAVKHNDDVRSLIPDPPGGLQGFDEAVAEARDDYDPRLWGRTLGAVSAGVLACALVGSLLTNPDSGWYRALRKPALQPPAAAFPVVWSTLYASIAIASAATIADLTEEGRTAEADAFRRALAANLVLNAAWSGVFFRLHELRLSTAVAAVLAASSGDLARRAAAAGPGKAAALGLYAAWCSFATGLSASFAALNSARRPRRRTG